MKADQEQEILSRLELIIALLRENNEILGALLTNVRDDHKTNSQILDEFGKLRWNSLNNGNSSSATKKLRQEQLIQIINEVKYAYSEGRINEKHYDLLNKAISNLESKEE
jgi:hypothetical protein